MDHKKKNTTKALDQFLGKEEDDVKVIDSGEGLVERINKKLVTAKGKQLLREVY